MSQRNEFSLIWMSRVSYEWVVSRPVLRSILGGWKWHTWMSHVSREWVMSHMNELCLVLYCAVYLDTGNGTHEWVMSHVNASCLVPCCVVHGARELEIARINEAGLNWIRRISCGRMIACLMRLRRVSCLCCAVHGARELEIAHIIGATMEVEAETFQK